MIYNNIKQDLNNQETACMTLIQVISISIGSHQNYNDHYVDLEVLMGFCTPQQLYSRVRMNTEIFFI